MRLKFALAVFILSAVPALAAPVTYNYSGQNFDTVVGTTYTTSDHITGTFTLDAPLGANLVDVTVTPTSFSFSDGVQTITNLTATTSFFNFITDANGSINTWTILVELSPADYIRTSVDPLDTASLARGNSARVTSHSDADDFTVVNVTPEPSSLALLGTGVAGIATLRRRMRRA